MTPSSVCIYCKQQNKPFTDDHVIPEAFGRFHPDIKLRDCVCHECNQYFGDTIELRLARGSIEGLMRWKHGLKSPAEANKILQKWISTTVEDAGDWQGTKGKLVAGSADRPLAIDPAPQVGYRRKSDKEWTWIAEEGLTEETAKPFQEKEVEIKIAASSKRELERLNQKLKNLGINFSVKRQLSSSPSTDGVTHVKSEALVDETIFRAIAKISFNYLAWIQGATFTLGRDFDEIRRFVRFAEMPAWRPVALTRKPILLGENRVYKQTNGHLVTINWDRKGTSLVSQVSLFNALKYYVTLCRYYSDLWYDIGRGHHFDLESREATELKSGRLVMPVLW